VCNLHSQQWQSPGAPRGALCPGARCCPCEVLSPVGGPPEGESRAMGHESPGAVGAASAALLYNDNGLLYGDSRAGSASIAVDDRRWPLERGTNNSGGNSSGSNSSGGSLVHPGCGVPGPGRPCAASSGACASPSAALSAALSPGRPPWATVIRHDTGDTALSPPSPALCSIVPPACACASRLMSFALHFSTASTSRRREATTSGPRQRHGVPHQVHLGSSRYPQTSRTNLPKKKKKEEERSWAPGSARRSSPGAPWAPPGAPWAPSGTQTRPAQTCPNKKRRRRRKKVGPRQRTAFLTRCTLGSTCVGTWTPPGTHRVAAQTCEKPKKRETKPQPAARSPQPAARSPQPAARNPRHNTRHGSPHDPSSL